MAPLVDRERLEFMPMCRGRTAGLGSGQAPYPKRTRKNAKRDPLSGGPLFGFGCGGAQPPIPNHLAVRAVVIELIQAPMNSVGAQAGNG